MVIGRVNSFSGFFSCVWVLVMVVLFVLVLVVCLKLIRFIVGLFSFSLRVLLFSVMFNWVMLCLCLFRLLWVWLWLWLLWVWVVNGSKMRVNSSGCMNGILVRKEKSLLCYNEFFCLFSLVDLVFMC